MDSLNSGPGIKIVIVDDSHDDQFFVKESLRKFPLIDFASFDNGAAFLDYLENIHSVSVGEFPDIVLLDMKMPGLSGLDVFQKIRQLQIDHPTRFYILSSSLSKEDHARCKEYGIEGFIKPHTLEDYRVLLNMLMLKAFNHDHPRFS